MRVGRKTTVGLTLLTPVLGLLLAVFGLYLRQAEQKRVATRIEQLGGQVEVRWNGWDWLLHFASDDCREHFPEAAAIPTWGPEWGRSYLGRFGYDWFVGLWDVADLVVVRIHDGRIDGDHVTPSDLPDVITEISRLATLREVKYMGYMECNVPLRDLPDSVRAVRVFAVRTEGVDVEIHSLPAKLEVLDLGITRPSRTTPDLTLLSTLSQLRALRISGIEVTEASLQPILSCRRLQTLALPASRLNSRAFAQVREMPGLEAVDVRIEQLVAADVSAWKAKSGLHSLMLRFIDDSTDTRETIAKECASFPQLTLLTEWHGVTNEMRERLQLASPLEFSRISGFSRATWTNENQIFKCLEDLSEDFLIQPTYPMFAPSQGSTR